MSPSTVTALGRLEGLRAAIVSVVASVAIIVRKARVWGRARPPPTRRSSTLRPAWTIPGRTWPTDVISATNLAFWPFIWPNLTVPSVVSPFALIEKLPSTPFVTLRLNSFDATSARVPFDFAIAPSRTCAACAAYAAVRVGQLAAVFLREPDHELRPGALQRLDRDARVADVGAVRGVAGRLARRRERREPVRHEDRERPLRAPP